MSNIPKIYTDMPVKRFILYTDNIDRLVGGLLNYGYDTEQVIQMVNDEYDLLPKDIIKMIKENNFKEVKEQS